MTPTPDDTGQLNDRRRDAPPPAPTLRDLVHAKVGKGRPITYAAFGQAAVDPVTGYQASSTLVQWINKGKPIKIAPKVLRAIAAGIREDPERVKRAAAREYADLRLDYDPALDFMPETVDDMTWDPVPDDHSAELVVTGSGQQPVSAQMKAMLLDLVRQVEQGTLPALSPPADSGSEE